MKHGYVILQFVSSSGNTCDVMWESGLQIWKIFNEWSFLGHKN